MDLQLRQKWIQISRGVCSSYTVFTSRMSSSSEKVYIKRLKIQTLERQQKERRFSHTWKGREIKVSQRWKGSSEGWAAVPWGDAQKCGEPRRWNPDIGGSCPKNDPKQQSHQTSMQTGVVGISAMNKVVWLLMTGRTSPVFWWWSRS